MLVVRIADCTCVRSGNESLKSVWEHWSSGSGFEEPEEERRGWVGWVLVVVLMGAFVVAIVVEFPWKVHIAGQYTCRTHRRTYVALNYSSVHTTPHKDSTLKQFEPWTS